MENSEQNTSLAKLVLISAVLALLLLVILHFISPEFDPSWRMVSEYALGSHQWALTLFFLLWGFSTICLAIILKKEVSSIWAKAGVFLLFVSGIGTAMAAAFDVEHPLHGLAAALGIPTLIIAALLISYHLSKKPYWATDKKRLLLSAHSTWLSLVLMVAAMMLMMSGFQNAGIEYSENTAPPESVPDGVIALGGYVNRLLILAYISWLIITAKIYIKIHGKAPAGIQYNSELVQASRVE